MAGDFKNALDSAHAQIDFIVTNHEGEQINELGDWLRKELEEMYEHAEAAVEILSGIVDERDEEIGRLEERIGDLEKELEERPAGDD